MEAEIAHLKQENGILRDAVSNTTNQLESKYVSNCFSFHWIAKLFSWIRGVIFDGNGLHLFLIFVSKTYYFSKTVLWLYEELQLFKCSMYLCIVWKLHLCKFIYILYLNTSATSQTAYKFMRQNLEVLNHLPPSTVVFKLHYSVKAPGMLVEK